VDSIEDAKVRETKLGAKLDAKHGAKDGIKLDIKLGVKVGVNSSAKPITILGTKLDVILGAKLNANFASIFAPYLIKWTEIAPKMGSRCKKGSKKGC